MDSNGDGVGDLQGIIGKLDFLVHMGYDALWLSPIYPSPMADFGYDVSDYSNVHAEYGTLEDFDELVKECRIRKVKVILDFVPNHCSSEHPWFKSALSSTKSCFRDWFIWHDPAPEGGPPNNWLGAFGGPAWTFDSSSGQYYMHSFLPEQPDLNWNNPKVREAMFDALRFWMGKGVDGFRVDVILRLVKDKFFRDEPPNPEWHDGMDPYDKLLHIYTRNAEGSQEFVRMFRQVIEEKPGTVLIGETYLPVPEIMAYYGKGDGCHLPFNFGLMTTKFSPTAFAAYINNYLAALPPGAWPNWVLDNHDKPRISASERFGPEGAAAAILLLYLLPGTITAYYGDELPMADAVITPDRIRDPKVLREGGGSKSRDSCRTPMQWDASAYAGFSSVEPWLPVNGEYTQVNVVLKKDDPNSILSMTKKLIALRARYSQIIEEKPKASTDSNGLLYLHNVSGSSTIIGVFNFSSRNQTIPIDSPGNTEILLSTKMQNADRTYPEGTYTLQPFEGLAYITIQ